MRTADDVTFQGARSLKVSRSKSYVDYMVTSVVMVLDRKGYDRGYEVSIRRLYISLSFANSLSSPKRKGGP